MTSQSTIVYWITPAFVSCASALTTTAAFANTWSYFIDENTSYANAPCPFNPPMNNVNTITASLEQVLPAWGSSTGHWYNVDAWGTDWVEGCDRQYNAPNTISGVNGDDYDNADNATLAVFAGHGGLNDIVFPFGVYNVCDVYPYNNARLGEMSHGTKGPAAYAMWLTCDSLSPAPSYLNSGGKQQLLAQEMGFNTIISIADNEPRDFFNNTGTMNNVNGWMLQFNNDADDTDTPRQPVIVSWGSTQLVAQNVHNYSSLKQNAIYARAGASACGQGLSAFWWYATWGR